MTVKELIERLQQMPQDLKVAVYCDLSEDSSMPHKVEIHTQETGPYNKADDVWNIYGLPEEEQIVFIT